MHVNVCIVVGRVSKAGPKLTYASSGTPCCSLVVEVDEFGPGDKIFTTWLPIRITGRYAEQSSVDLEPGDIVMVSGKLKYESTMDAKTQTKTSKLIISSWGIQQRQPAETSPGTADDSASDDGALLVEAPSVPEPKKVRQPRIPKASRLVWSAEHGN